MRPEGVRLGLGLIAIGRQWGHRKQPIPTAEECDAFLTGAIGAGIRFLDTAPSYGFSEERLGRFLAAQSVAAPEELFIATKAGEHWRPENDTLFVDHSYDALVQSIDRSLERLGRIDLLQVHKASLGVVSDAGVRGAMQYAKSRGVRSIGASVTDLETARAVIADDLYQAIQIPYHLKNRSLEAVFAAAAEAGKLVLVNRPFGMGELLYDEAAKLDPHRRRVDAFRLILENASSCVVLTGTRSLEHLRENFRAFREAETHAAAPDPACR